MSTKPIMFRVKSWKKDYYNNHKELNSSETESDNDTKSESDLCKFNFKVLNKLDIVDERNNMKCYHYPRLDNTQIPKNLDYSEFKGIVEIDDENEPRAVIKTFGFVEEVSVKDKNKLYDILCQTETKGLFKNGIKFYKSVEGFGITLFYYKNKWHIKTNRKLDAYSSKWGCEVSFGEIFENSIKHAVIQNRLFPFANEKEIFDIYLSKLDVSKTYTFIVQNISDNRLVCHAPLKGYVSNVYFTGEFANNLLISSNTSLLSKTEELKFDCLDNLVEYVEKMNYFKNPGIIAYLDHNQIKVNNHKYIEYFNVRDNEPNLQLQYFNVANDPEKVSKLYELYPEYIGLFQQHEKNLIRIINVIYDIHYDRMKRYVFTNRELHEVLLDLSRYGNNLSITMVSDKLDSMKPLDQYKLSMLLINKTLHINNELIE